MLLSPEGDRLDEKQEIINRDRSYLVCRSQGSNNNITEQLIALYKIVYSLIDLNLLAVIDREIYNLIPRSIFSEKRIRGTSKENIS